MPVVDPKSVTPYVQQSGRVTPGHVTQFVTTGVISDSGVPVSQLHTTTSNPNLITVTNVDSGTLIIGEPVYVFSANSVKAAQANGLTSGSVVGLANAAIAMNASGQVVTAGNLSLTTAQWTALTGGALSPGSLYFLDPATAGRLTTTPPSTPGQVIALIGRAVSTTLMVLAIEPPVLL